MHENYDLKNSMNMILMRSLKPTAYMDIRVYMCIWTLLVSFVCVLKVLMPRLQTFERDRAIGMLSAGQTVANVARAFNVNPATIVRLRHRFQTTGSVSDAPRSGRPRSLSNADDRYIRLSSLRDRFRPATSITNDLNRTRNVNVTAQTVRNRLHQSGLNARRPEIAVQLTDNHRRLRRQWAQMHQRWNMAQWRTVLFSDESRFNLDFADRRRRVWRRRNERYARCCILEHDRYGGGSVMVWGAVSWNRKSDLVVIDGNLNAQRYVNEILRPNVLPLVRRYNMIFQQDNARPHTARVSRDFLNNHNIRNLPWPARSPDLSPIEHVWDLLGRNVRSHHHVRTRQQMIAALRQEWNAIPQNSIRTIIGSMRRRCMACIRANGGHTSY